MAKTPMKVASSTSELQYMINHDHFTVHTNVSKVKKKGDMK